MIALLCIAASGVAFFFSLNHGEVWPLAWIAPVPVLWFAFGPAKRAQVFAVCWAAYALGATNILSAYAGELPLPVLLLIIGGPALYFAFSATLARFVFSRLGAVPAMLAFAASWTAFDYLVGLGRDGTAPSPAYSQVGAPAMIQLASIFGLWIVTFLLGLVPAGIALSLRKRTLLPAGLALLALVTNAGYGAWRLSHSGEGAITRIGLAGDDSVSAAATMKRPELALAAASDYAYAAQSLAQIGARFIVFPEKVARLMAPATRDAVDAILRDAARRTQATIVIGFDDRIGTPRNEARVYAPDGSPPAIYDKRHFVGGLEDIFVPGAGPVALGQRTDVEICKDMDYPRMLRTDSRTFHPTLLLVPAWDFDADRWWHARLAIMRGVEDGFALARSAKDGLLTLTDAEGRMKTRAATVPRDMVTRVADVRRGPGETLYLKIGDVFAWASIALALLLIGGALARPRSGEKATPPR